MSWKRRACARGEGGRMKKLFRVVAVLAVLTLVASACKKKTPEASSPAPPATTATTSVAPPSPSALPGAGLTGCEVTDTGGIDDKSFNATAYKGLTDAATKYGITPKFLESQTEDDYAPNIQAFIGKCDLIVTVGFLLGDATEKAAKDNPDQDFAIVDFAYDPTIPNVLGLTFSTDQAAFLAGYLAAGMSQSGKIGTFGGINIPSVTIFMNGFAAGILAYNQDSGTNVPSCFFGSHPRKQDGTFTGDFEDQNKGKQVTEQ